MPQAGYDSAYNSSFPSDSHAYARATATGLTFTPVGAAQPVTKTFKKKTIIGVFSNTDGRMSVKLGVELPFVNNQTPTTIDYTVQDPATELLKNSVTPIGTAGDGTQLWRITHNDVDTHPIHFHLFDVQLVNRIDAVGVVKPPEPNELGWKDTVRMNPLGGRHRGPASDGRDHPLGRSRQQACHWIRPCRSAPPWASATSARPASRSRSSTRS